MAPAPPQPTATMPLLPVLAALLIAIPTAQASPVNVAVSVYCVEFAGDLKTVELEIAADRFVELSLSTANILPPQDVEVTDEQLSFHHTGPGPDGSPIRQLGATATVPAGLDAAIIVLIPAAAETGPPYRTLVLAHADGEFPFGSYQLVNLTSHQVRGNIGPVDVAIDPDASALIHPDSADGELMAVVLEYLDGGRWLRFIEARWAKVNDRRSLIIIHIDPRRNRLMLRSIPDRTHLIHN